MGKFGIVVFGGETAPGQKRSLASTHHAPPLSVPEARSDTSSQYRKKESVMAPVKVKGTQQKYRHGPGVRYTLWHQLYCGDA